MLYVFNDRHQSVDGDPWQFSYLFPKPDEPVVWGPYQVDGYPYKALSLLFGFQGTNMTWISDEQRILKDHIKNHLMKFGGADASKKYTDISQKIDTVCEKAKPLLIAYTDIVRPAREEHTSTSPLYKLAFEERWLTNICRLLPDDPEILKVLPYLLTCYTLDIWRNCVDPFDQKSNQYSNNRAWVDIYYDQASPAVKEQRKLYGGVRRSDSIDKICSYFILPTNYKCSAFLGYLQVCDYTHSPKGRILKPRERASYCLACWEAYRRFACFCTACKDIIEVDLILSMALFSSIWDYRSLCRPLCANPICEGRDRRCRFESPICVEMSDKDFCALELNEPSDSGEPTIQEFVFNMWNEYRYNNRPKAGKALVVDVTDDGNDR